MTINLGDIAALAANQTYPSKASDFGRTLQKFAEAIEDGTATFTNKTYTSPTINGAISSIADDTTWVLKANDATALLIGPAAVPGLITLDTRTAADKVTITGDCDVAGGLTVAGSALVLGGALTTSGAFATTITASATTAVTLPVSGNLRGFVKYTCGYADLNTAGTGVAAIGGESIPIGAIVTRVYFNTTEAFETDNNEATTMSIGIQDQAVDVQADVSINGAPWTGTGWEEGSVGIDGTAAKFVEVSATTKQIAVIGSLVGTDTAFNAGSMVIYAEYVY